MTRTEALKTAKPILFNTEMVKAILDGRKTVTRRVLKNQDKNAFTYDWNYKDGVKDDVDIICDRNGDVYALANKPPCHTDDILYVRETWCWCPCWDCGQDTPEVCIDPYARRTFDDNKGEWGCIGYKASFAENEHPPGLETWKPSIHMPKEAARIFLRVTDVRVEQLQEINADGIRNEGLTSMAVHVGDMEIAQAEFALLWDSTVKKSDLERYGWAANPWVWVIEFERVEVQE